MPTPYLQVDIAFGAKWNDASPVWTPVTPLLRHNPPLRISRGRDSRFNKTRPSTLVFALDNNDRQFDPDWSGSSYYGDLVPLTPVRVVSRVNESPGQYVSTTGVVDEIIADYATSVTGDLRLEWRGKFVDLTPAATEDLLTQGTDTAYNHRLSINTTGNLVLRVQDATPTTYTYTSSVTLGSVGIVDSAVWATATDTRLRADLDLTNGANSVCKFYYSTDNGTTWTQLGSDRTSTTITALRSVTQKYRISGNSVGNASTQYHVEGMWVDGIGGTTVANVDFADYGQWMVGQTTGVDPQNNTWITTQTVSTVSGVFHLFRGFISSWDISTEEHKDSTVTVTASDGLSVLNMLAIPGGYESEVSSDSPLGWWKLDETSGTTATDSGSAGVNGTYTNTPSLNQTGPLTGAKGVSFDDGSSEDMTVGALTGSNVATAWSVEAWVKPDPADTTANQAVVVWGNSSSDDKLGMGFNGSDAGTSVAHDATSSGTTASSTSHSITLPGAASGAAVFVTVTTTGGATVVWPAGWTELWDRAAFTYQYAYNATGTPPAGSGWVLVSVTTDPEETVYTWRRSSAVGSTAAAYRIYPGSVDASITITTSSAVATQYAATSFTGVSTIEYSATTGTSGTLNAPSYTAPDAVPSNGMWVSLAAGRRPSGPTAATPSGYSLSVSNTTGATLLNRHTYKAGTSSATENPAASDSNTGGYTVTGQATIALYPVPTTVAGLFTVRFTDTNGQTGAHSTETILPFDAWSHLCVTANNTTSTIVAYVNGKAVKTWTNWDTTADTGTAYITVAKNRSVYALADAVISHVAFYQSTLSAARVAAHYAAPYGTLAAADTDDRVDAVLDLVGWPSNDRVTPVTTGAESTGQTTVAAWGGAATNALALIQRAEESEHGRFWIRPNGNAAFGSRREPSVQVVANTDVLFSNDGSDTPYRNFTPYRSDINLRNQAVVSTTAGNTYTAENLASVNRYAPRSVEVTTDTSDTSLEAQDYADWLIGEHADPLTDTQLTCLVGNSHANSIWTELIGIDAGDYITVENKPVGGTTQNTYRAFVETLDWTIDSELWRLDLTLSNYEGQVVFVVGDDELGVLDGPGRVGW